MSRHSITKAITAKLDTTADSQSASENVSNIQVILNELSEDKGLLLTAETVSMLAASGVSVHNVCKMFRKSFSYLNEQPHLLAAYEQGRAQAGARMRGTLMDAALEGGNIQSAIYLDKILSGDTVVSEVNLTVGVSQLSTVSDDDLMRVAFTVEGFDDASDGGGSMNLDNPEVDPQ